MTDALDLTYRAGDGNISCDTWEIGTRFSVWCEGCEWMGRVTRVDGAWYDAFAYPIENVTVEHVDPAGLFALDRCVVRGRAKPTSDEIDMLNRMKQQIFERHTDQITTGRTTREAL